MALDFSLKLDWNALLSVSLRWGHFVSSTYRETDIEVVRYREDGPLRDDTVVRILRGSSCRTGFSLFDHWGAALQFPYYFGYNMNAFYDCIRDLGWLRAKHYVLVITEANRLLGDEDDRDFAGFLSVLEDAARDWACPAPLNESTPEIRARYGRGAVSFHVLFQSTPDHSAEMIRRYEAARYTFDTLVLEPTPLSSEGANGNGRAV